MPFFGKTAQPLTAIKSIQRGTIDLVGQTSQTATITSVDTSKSVIELLGFTAAGLGADSSAYVSANFARLALTNATTVTATRQSNANPNGIVIAFQVTEFV